jgi:transposase
LPVDARASLIVLTAQL